jgi:hypothetical protein
METKNIKLCDHGNKIKSCLLCDGPHKCTHNILKQKCRDCNKSTFCVHHKFKYNCKECDGRNLCVHDRQKRMCKECNGSAYCEHGTRKYNCKVCKGSQVCIHNKIKSNCTDCGNEKICQHKKIKYYCKLCDGRLICSHNRIVHVCKDCKGSQICQHNKKKVTCRECGGGIYCEHDKRRRDCIDCDGINFCSHKKRKVFCKICDGRYLCKSEWCEIRGIEKYNGYCFNCCLHLFPDTPVYRNYKTKENAVAEYIQKSFPNFAFIHDKRVVNGVSKRRPDLLLNLENQVIIVEVDENKHCSYDCICENKRLMEISQDLQHKPIVFLRFNPDSYIDLLGKTIKSCWKVNKQTGIFYVSEKKEWEIRLEVLVDSINYFIENEIDKTIEIIELFY